MGGSTTSLVEEAASFLLLLPPGFLALFDSSSMCSAEHNYLDLAPNPVVDSGFLIIEELSSSASLFFLDCFGWDGDLWGIRGTSRLNVGRYQCNWLIVYTLHPIADGIPSVRRR